MSGDLKACSIEQMEKYDMYQTPKELVSEIVKKYKEYFPEVDEVQEPCCGYGMFCQSFIDNGITKIHINDIQDSCVQKAKETYKAHIVEATTQDVFKINLYKNVITNPPFSQLNEKLYDKDKVTKQSAKTKSVYGKFAEKVFKECDTYAFICPIVRILSIDSKTTKFMKIFDADKYFNIGIGSLIYVIGSKDNKDEMVIEYKDQQFKCSEFNLRTLKGKFPQDTHDSGVYFKNVSNGNNMIKNKHLCDDTSKPKVLTGITCTTCVKCGCNIAHKIRHYNGPELKQLKNKYMVLIPQFIIGKKKHDFIFISPEDNLLPGPQYSVYYSEDKEAMLKIFKKAQETLCDINVQRFHRKMIE